MTMHIKMFRESYTEILFIHNLYACSIHVCYLTANTTISSGRSKSTYCCLSVISITLVQRSYIAAPHKYMLLLTVEESWRDTSVVNTFKRKRHTLNWILIFKKYFITHIIKVFS